MALSGSELTERLIEACVSAGAEVIEETARHQRPILLQVRLGQDVLPLRIFLWNITHGGARRAADEYRVQTTRPDDEPFLLDGDDRLTLLLGFHEELEVFAAWDVRVHPNPGGSSSLQVPLDLLREARRTGFASRLREIQGDSELVVAFRPGSLDAYLDACERLVAVEMPSGSTAVAAATGGQDIPPESLPEDVERRREIRQVEAVVRDRRFRRAVVDAYSERCAFCGLGLGIVEAAHIQGVASDGPDVVPNGIAACPNHHKAFDRGLLLISDDGGIAVNEPRAEAIGIPKVDIAQLRDEVNDTLASPTNPQLRPATQYVEHHREKWSVHN